MKLNQYGWRYRIYVGQGEYHWLGLSDDVKEKLTQLCSSRSDILVDLYLHGDPYYLTSVKYHRHLVSETYHSPYHIKDRHFSNTKDLVSFLVALFKKVINGYNSNEDM